MSSTKSRDASIIDLPDPLEKEEGSQPENINDLSIEREIKEEHHHIEIAVDNNNQHLETENERNSLAHILDKAKTRFHASIAEVQTYVHSLAGPSMEDVDNYITSMGDLNDGRDLHDISNITPKMWVIYDMTRLGFEDNDIREVAEYLEDVPDTLTREELMRRAIEHLIEGERRQIVTIDISSGNRIPEEVVQATGGIFNIPAPPLRSRQGQNNRSITNIENIRIITITNKNATSAMEKKAEAVNLKKIVFKPEAIEEKAGTYECLICYNDIPENKKEDLFNCKHKFCRSCYRDYIIEQIDNNKVLNICCPQGGCEESFKDEQISGFLTETQFLKYKRFKKGALLNSNPNLRWCVKPGCDSYVVGKPGTRKLVCVCGTRICFTCGSKYHFRKSCETVIEGVYKKYAKEQQVQTCPQCVSRIEKSGGCNHMTCTRCSYQWCWLCGLQYTLDHYNRENPTKCKKMVEEEERSRPVERNTCATRICQEPFLLLAFPLFLTLLSALVPQWLYSSYQKKKLGARYNPQNDNSTVLCFFAILGIVLLPISMVSMLVLMTADTFVDIYLCFCSKVLRRDYRFKCRRVFQPEIF